MKNILNEKHEKDLFKLIDKHVKNNSKSFICTNGTGTGKTPAINYLISKLKDKKIAVITPLKHTNFKNADTFTYTKFGMESYFDIFKKYHVFIFDEAHHSLSERCILTLDKLKKLKKKIYGFTADPERSDGLNTIDEFGGDKNNLCTCLWEDGVNSGLFKKPNYIYTTYKTPKTKGTKRLSLGSKSLQKTFKKWVSKNKKIIVFASNEKQLELIMSQTLQLFKKYNLKPFIYTYHHQDNKNVKLFNIFRKSTSTGYVCFTINKFIEGYHIDNIDCIMVFRSTRSKRIVNQIRGRIANYKQNKRPTIIDCCSMYKLFGEDTFIMAKNELKTKKHHPQYYQYVCCDYEELQQDILQYIEQHGLKYIYNGMYVSSSMLSKMFNIDRLNLNSWLRDNKITIVTDEIIQKYKDIHRKTMQGRPEISVVKEIKKMFMPFHASYFSYRDNYVKNKNYDITLETARKYLEEVCIPRLNFMKLKKEIIRKGYKFELYTKWCRKKNKDIYSSFNKYKESLVRNQCKYGRHIFSSKNELCRYYNITSSRISKVMKLHKCTFEQAIDKILDYKKNKVKKIYNPSKTWEFKYKNKTYSSINACLKELGNIPRSSINSIASYKGISMQKAIDIYLNKR